MCTNTQRLNNMLLNNAWLTMRSRMKSKDILRLPVRMEAGVDTLRLLYNHRNGDHMDGYQQGSGRGREGEKVQRISSINSR